MIALAAPALWLPPKPAIIRPAELRRADRILDRSGRLVEAMPCMPGFRVTRPPATATYIGGAQFTNPASTYTTGSIGLGTPLGTSVVVTIWTIFGGGINGTSLTSILIDSAGASQIQAPLAFVLGSTNTFTVMSYLVTSNTTGVCQFKCSTNQVGGRVNVWRLNLLSSAAPFHSNNTSSTANVTTLSTTVNIPGPNGLVLAGHGAYENASASVLPLFTAGVATQDARTELVAHGYQTLGGHETGLAAQSGRTVSISQSSFPNTCALVAASWY